MNVFYTSTDPYECALALDDRRVNKMIIETAQLLCTVLRRTYVVDDPVLYRVSHVNHPDEIWARQPANFMWLLEHGLSLFLVRQLAGYGDHKSFNVLLHIESHHSFEVTRNDVTPCPNCTTFKGNPNTIEAYRDYLNMKWNRELAGGYTPTWHNRQPPMWRELGGS